MSGHGRCERNDGSSSLPSQRPSACPEVVLSQAESGSIPKRTFDAMEGWKHPSSEFISGAVKHLPRNL